MRIASSKVKSFSSSNVVPPPYRAYRSRSCPSAASLDKASKNRSFWTNREEPLESHQIVRQAAVDDTKSSCVPQRCLCAPSCAFLTAQRSPSHSGVLHSAVGGCRPLDWSCRPRKTTAHDTASGCQPGIVPKGHNNRPNDVSKCKCAPHRPMETSRRSGLTAWPSHDFGWAGGSCAFAACEGIGSLFGLRLIIASVGSGEPLLVDIAKLTYDKGYCSHARTARSAMFQPKDLDKEDCWNACPAYYYQGSAHACCAYRVLFVCLFICLF